MNAGRLVWIFLIFVAISICWAILGGSVTQRTREADTNLREQVEGLWGQPIVQLAPNFTISHAEERTDKGETKTVWVPEGILADSNNINVNMKLDLRRKGLLWYRCYTVSFDAEYAVSHTYESTVWAGATFALPTAAASYANFACTFNGKPLLPVPGQSQIEGRVQLTPGQKGKLHVHYETRGLETWQYKFAEA